MTLQTTLKVRRFNPEQQQSYWQEYTLDVEPQYTVLDALIKIREYEDGTLTLRCSCRSSICGSCAIRIDGHATLACKTKLRTLPSGGRNVTVEPLGNLPIIKDLVVDMRPHWDKVMAIKPWLQPQGTEPEHEYIAPNETMLHLAGVMSCIMCGACVGDCTVLEVDPNFLGPAALAKAYRFVGDPRDGSDKERLKSLNGYGGIWDCTRCFQCVQACPKGVAPMERIMSLRDKAIEAGFDNTYGARHTVAFGELIEHGGTLDELRLPIKTFGMFNLIKMLELLPVGLRALMRKKMPPVFHKPITKVENVRRIFQKMESKR